MSEYKDYRPDWIKELAEKLAIKIDSEEEYVEKSTDIDLYEFNRFLDQCESVWTVTPTDFRYGDTKLQRKKFFSTAGLVDNCLAQGIKKKEIPAEDVPLIPIIEYKLVPTGNIIYFDINKTRTQRYKERYRNDPEKRERYLQLKKAENQRAKVRKQQQEENSNDKNEKD